MEQETYYQKLYEEAKLELQLLKAELALKKNEIMILNQVRETQAKHLLQMEQQIKAFEGKKEK
ncbi:hypothetical protein HDC92_002493 [Pedobacter sp. AK017]|uniref:hypothetical protein n=1 Tax=Pedobacter sp. AK017 TaxID=2723073 RepID=UPI00160C8961|nr:hypothetical protein [Pedobacter sp. AK017]MBB5438812.1 hypothetical protein [Pedobacter sp. AK017]